MTQDEIIEMAKEACPYTSARLRGAFYDGFLKASKLVDDKATAREREACAIACETDGRDLAGLYYAGVIRARGES